MPPSRYDGSTHSGHGREFPRDKVDGWKYRGRNDVPKYTTDPAAAMQVLEKCAEMFDKRCDGHGACVSLDAGEWAVIESDTCKGARAYASTLPLAIALFARGLFKEETK